MTMLPFATTLRDEAEEWMAANPVAMDLFRRFARDMLNRNHRFGISLLTERVRWECAVLYAEGTYKINNNHRAYVARRLIEEVPELGRLLVTRRVRS